MLVLGYEVVAFDRGDEEHAEPPCWEIETHPWEFHFIVESWLMLCPLCKAWVITRMVKVEG